MKNSFFSLISTSFSVILTKGKRNRDPLAHNWQDARYDAETSTQCYLYGTGRARTEADGAMVKMRFHKARKAVAASRACGPRSRPASRSRTRTAGSNTCADGDRTPRRSARRPERRPRRRRRPGELARVCARGHPSSGLASSSAVCSSRLVSRGPAVVLYGLSSNPTREVSLHDNRRLLSLRIP